MPSNPKQQPAQPPRNSTVISSSKYTNKDGSKFITIPKVISNSESSETSDNTMAQTTTKQTHRQVAQSPTMTDDTPVAVNRKKAKRREKERAKLAAATGQTTQVNGTQDASTLGKLGPEVWQDYARKEHQRSLLGNPQYLSGDEDAFSECYNYEESMTPPNGHSAQSPRSKTGKRKGKGKNTKSVSPKPATSTTHPNSDLRMSREKIWNTSSQEERERIKVFWLSLGEEERRSLVKVEKDAVLKKMKEQQKHSCSCTVCGRKRIAIEEELEVLYDAYYEELEQYANNQSDGRPPPLMAGSRRFGALSGLAPPNRIPPRFTGHPPRGRIVEHFGDEDDDEDDEEYSEDDVDDDDYLSGDDEPIEQITRTHANDFFNFGQNLTVKGGILTVADDLLKNDGKKFIEMMEQLAERRMAREEDAKENYGPNNYPHPSNLPPHSHHNHHNHHNHHTHLPPPEDEEEYDDEDEDEDGYDSEEEFDEEEMDTMTEEQRMEEGRRMFQIFAARMFEQRVLTAYKEKVAAERQEKLLQELEEEDEAATLKKAKKAKEAQKKKEKAHAKKLAQAEEKTKRDAEKAAEEAKRFAEEAKKAEEARLRAEEKRKKKEAQKRAEEEERLRKEAEKQRKLQEQRERQAEQERKKKDEKERIAREKEEQRQREKEAKETKEREARERKEKLEREKKETEERQRAEQHARESRQREEAQLRRSQQQSSVPAQGSVPSAAASQAPSFPPTSSAAPTPGRPAFLQRDPSSVPQTPLFGLAKTQNTSPQTSSTPSQSSPGTQTLPVRHQSQPFLHHPQATSPMHSALRSSFSQFQSGPFAGMQQQSSMNGFPQPGGFPPMGAPGFGGRMQHEPVFQNQPFGNHFRPPMFSGGLPPPQGRGFPGQHAPPPGLPPMQNGFNGFNGFPPGFGIHKEAAPIQMHSRQQSGSMDSVAIDLIRTPSLAFVRPTPIKRPGSDGNNSRGQKQEQDLEDMTNHLGSSALLDDSDEPIAPPMNPRRASAAPASLGRHAGFAPSMAYGGMDPSAFSSSPGGYNTWGPHSNPFTTGSLPGPSYMSGWGNSPSLPNGFAGLGGLSGLGGGMPMRTSQPRSVAIRLMLCRACKNLSASGSGRSDNFHPITDVRLQIGEDVVSEKELLDLCETEGNGNNGGGFFDVRKDSTGTLCIRYEADDGVPQTQRSVPGDIGSPIVGSAGLMSFGGRGSIASPPGLGAAGPPPGLSAPMGGF